MPARLACSFILASLVVGAPAAAVQPRLELDPRWLRIVEPWRYDEARRFESGWHRGADVVAAAGVVRAPVGGRIRFVGRVAGRLVATLDARIAGAPAVVTLTGLDTVMVSAGEVVSTGEVVGRAGALHVGAYDAHRRSRYLPVVVRQAATGVDEDRELGVRLGEAVADRLAEAISGAATPGVVETASPTPAWRWPTTAASPMAPRPSLASGAATHGSRGRASATGPIAMAVLRAMVAGRPAMVAAPAVEGAGIGATSRSHAHHLVVAIPGPAGSGGAASRSASGRHAPVGGARSLGGRGTGEYGAGGDGTASPGPGTAGSHAAPIQVTWSVHDAPGIGIPRRGGTVGSGPEAHGARPRARAAPAADVAGLGTDTSGGREVALATVRGDGAGEAPGAGPAGRSRLAVANGSAMTPLLALLLLAVVARRLLRRRRGPGAGPAARVHQPLPPVLPVACSKAPPDVAADAARVSGAWPRLGSGTRTNDLQTPPGTRARSPEHA